jgi:glycosyltransferase 2 family protein
MRLTVWGWARPLGGAAILAVLIWRLGTGPFLHGLRMVNAGSLAAAAGIAVVTTVFCAWRWSLVAGGLGVSVPLRTAVAAYYRSQFLNTALPGGVLGDVHRGLSHGREAGDVSRGLRAVMWERFAGQVVQVVLAVLVLLVLPSPLRPWLPVIAAGAVVTLLGSLLVVRSLAPQGRAARTVRAAASDLRQGLLARDVWPGVALASVVVVLGHTLTFLIAARTAGASVSIVRLVPLAMIVLVAMALPISIGGWGPREGVAAWLFAAAGLGSASGVSTATVYGVMVLVSNLPGAVVLLAGLRGRARAEAADVELRSEELSVSG